MPRPLRCLAAVLIGAAVATGPRAAAAGPGQATSEGAAPARGADPAVRIRNPEAIEPAIARAINLLRRRRGLRPLTIGSALARAGDAHARALALAGVFTHAWPDGRPFVRWVTAFYPYVGYRQWRAGENLLWHHGEITPQGALALWLASPPHRRVLLGPLWREIGIGVVHAEHAPGAYGGHDVYIVAAEFGARS